MIYFSRPNGDSTRRIPPPVLSSSDAQWLGYASVIAAVVPLSFGFAEEAWQIANRIADAYEKTWPSASEGDGR